MHKNFKNTIEPFEGKLTPMFESSNRFFTNKNGDLVVVTSTSSSCKPGRNRFAELGTSNNYSDPENKNVCTFLELAKKTGKYYLVSTDGSNKVLSVYYASLKDVIGKTPKNKKFRLLIHMCDSDIRGNLKTIRIGPDSIGKAANVKEYFTMSKVNTTKDRVKTSTTKDRVKTSTTPNMKTNTVKNMGIGLGQVPSFNENKLRLIGNTVSGNTLIFIDESKIRLSDAVGKYIIYMLFYFKKEKYHYDIRLSRIVGERSSVLAKQINKIKPHGGYYDKFIVKPIGVADSKKEAYEFLGDSAMFAMGVDKEHYSTNL